MSRNSTSSSTNAMLSSRPLRVVLADDERDTQQFLQEVLSQLGHQVVGIADTGEQLIENCRLTQPDLVITDIRMPDMDGLQAAHVINRDRQVPVIVITAHHDTDFLANGGASHVMGYLSKPIKPVDLIAAINLATLRFDQLQQLTREAASLRQALDDRKLIERAKGIVMKRLGTDEEEAFRRLRKVASDHNQKLIETAQRVINSDEIFHQLERL